MVFIKKTLWAFFAVFVVMMVISACEKTTGPDKDSGTEQTPDGDNTGGDNTGGDNIGDGGSGDGNQPGDEVQPVVTDVNVPSEQFKYYMTASDDLSGKVTGQTSGMKVILMDSKFYAVDERVLSVSFQADKTISRVTNDGAVVSESSTVTMTWKSSDPVNRPKVGRSTDPGEYGMLCLPGEYRGKFTVKTDRYTYEFNSTVALVAGNTATVTLDFASPLVQPKRKVGIMGDSISTFDGAMCNPEYAPYYPANDPNVQNNPSIAVNSKERTYWWMLVNNYMQNGVLDVNSSWSGTRVIHEVKNGRMSGKSVNAGFVDRAYDFVDPDIIIIHGGTNDKNQSTPLGEYTWDLPIGQNDLTKYRSAYIELIKKLQNRYAGVQIIIIVGDMLTTDYATSTIEIAKHFNIPYVSFVGVNVPKCSGSHPTYPAFGMMANTIYNQCKDYLP